MRFLVALFTLTVSLIWTVTSIAEVTPFTATLRAVRGSDSKIDIQFCERRSCRSLGRNGGYQISEWRRIRNVCRQQSQYAGPVNSVVQSILVGAAVATGAPALWMVALFATPPAASDQTAFEAAGTLLPGAMRTDQHFTLSIDQFIALRNGIEQCALRFNQQARTEAILRNCENPMICNLEQAGQSEQYY